MARTATEYCDDNILELHNSIYPSVREQDEILKAYFRDKNRRIPSPLEIEIFQRQLRSEHDRIRLKNEKLTTALRETACNTVCNAYIESDSYINND